MSFEEKDYDAALSYAARVLHSFDPSMFTTLDKQAEADPVPSPILAPVSKPTSQVSVTSCDKCEKVLEPDDKFCRGCGEPFARTCSCGASLRQDDRFCGKCGEKVS
jgi:hypothetical protein